MHLYQGAIGEEELGLGRREALPSLELSRERAECAYPLGGFHRLGHAEQEAPVLGSVLEKGIQHGWAVGCRL
jgi:hypothetical protein